MRSVFDLHLRSVSLRETPPSGDGDASREPSPGEHSGERRLRLLRAVLGETHTPKSRPSTDPPQELGRT
jgi:hypothetical protein